MTHSASSDPILGNRMLIKRPADFRYSEVTPKSVYLNRRQLLRGVPAAFLAVRSAVSTPARAAPVTALGNLSKSPFSTGEPVTPAEITTRSSAMAGAMITAENGWFAFAVAVLSGVEKRICSCVPEGT